MAERPHVEDPYKSGEPYVGSADPGTVDKPKARTITIDGIKGGWIPYRGVEQHGVQQPQIEVDIDSWERDSQDEIDGRTFHLPKLRDAEPTTVIKGWAKEQAVRIKATCIQVSLPQDTWVKVLEKNPRRTEFRWWVDPSPQGSNPLQMTTDPNQKIVGLVPQLLGGGVANSAPWTNHFTDEFWLMSSGIARTFHVIEEYEVEA